MEFVFTFIFGYLVGSFPTAYLLLKRTKNLDITQNGSGNVGAMNSYEVSKSKTTGVIVFIIDGAKGFLAVLIARYFFEESFTIQILALIGAVFSHCYNPWIKFKGGRGLATAFGGALLLSIPILIVWIIIWLIAYAFRRNIHFGNFTASLLTAALAFSSANVLNKYTNPPAETEFNFWLTVLILFAIIISKHIIPIKEYFISQSQKVRIQKDESN